MTEAWYQWFRDSGWKPKGNFRWVFYQDGYGIRCHSNHKFYKFRLCRGASRNMSVWEDMDQFVFMPKTMSESLLEGKIRQWTRDIKLDSVHNA